jgi:hypothetical protein
MLALRLLLDFHRRAEKTINQRKNKQMKNITKYLAGTAVALGLAATVQAVPITGNITMGGGASFDTSSVNTATTITAWVGPNTVRSFNGFAGVNIGDVVVLTAPWTFVPSTPKAALWTVDGYTFDLTSSSVSQGGGFINITGIGTISALNYDTTPFAWRFSSSDPGAGSPLVWSWQGSTGEVPDGGMTVMLLGVALSSLGLIRRKLA